MRAEPGQVVCMTCEWRAAEEIERDGRGEVVFAVCAICASRATASSQEAPTGTLKIGGVIRTFHRGIYNAELK